MLERRDRARLLMEPEGLLLPLRRPVLGDAQTFQRDAFGGREIAAEIDDAHAALAELTHHLVTTREQRADLVRLVLLRCRRHESSGRARLLSLAQSLADGCS